MITHAKFGLPVFLACLGLVLVWMMSFPSVQARPAASWHTEPWMGAGKKFTRPSSTRILSITDLPALDPIPKPADYVAAIRKSSDAGCKGAVLTFSWPALEPSEGQLTLDELKGVVLLNKGRVLYLGIQILNTTVKDLPKDLRGKRLDDPEVIRRFKVLLDGLKPLLQSKVLYLSIGNEVDVYLSSHPDEFDPFKRFLEDVRVYAKTLAHHLVIGTTVTNHALGGPQFIELTTQMDAHFFTYYHGPKGTEVGFRDPTTTKDDLVALANSLDARPLVIQEFGYPSHTSLSSPDGQAAFVRGFFDAWDELGPRIPFANYFMLYDFSRAFAQSQIAYYGLSEDLGTFINFLSSLGLHEANGKARPAWEIFRRRGSTLR